MKQIKFKFLGVFYVLLEEDYECYVNSLLTGTGSFDLYYSQAKSCKYCHDNNIKRCNECGSMYKFLLVKGDIESPIYGDYWLGYEKDENGEPKALDTIYLNRTV